MNKFIDIDRKNIEKKYKDFLNSAQENSNEKNIELLEIIIKEDEDFFETYLSLHDYHARSGDLQTASEVLGKAYEKAVTLIMLEDRFPDELHWSNKSNRHIINILFNYATMLWAVKEYEEALYIFMQLLKSDLADVLGARFSILAILEGFENLDEFEEKFKAKDISKKEIWFEQNIKNHTQLMGWWLDK